jgi:hypothetical protein
VYSTRARDCSELPRDISGGSSSGRGVLGLHPAGDCAGGDRRRAFGAALLAMHPRDEIFEATVLSDPFGELVESEQFSLLALLAGHVD